MGGPWCQEELRLRNGSSSHYTWFWEDPLGQWLFVQHLAWCECWGSVISHSGNSCWRKLLCHSFFSLSSFCLTSHNPFLDVFTLLRCSSKCPSALQALYMYFFPNKWRHDMPFNFYFNSTSRDAVFCIKLTYFIVWIYKCSIIYLICPIFVGL